MPMKSILIPLALVVAGAAAAEAPYRNLTPACESALALSALPAHLRDRASTWVLGRGGFERHGAADADFSCLVARNHPDSLVPQCFDKPGQQAILPRYLDEGRMLAQGQSFDQIHAEIERRLKAREYQPVSAHGVVYMVSAYNYIYARNAGKLVHVHPHVMFHAPDVAPDAVGNSLRDGMVNKGLPFVIDEGVHGYMISMVERPSDGADVAAACAGQLPPAPAAL